MCVVFQIPSPSVCFSFAQTLLRTPDKSQADNHGALLGRRKKGCLECVQRLQSPSQLFLGNSLETGLRLAANVRGPSILKPHKNEQEQVPKTSSFHTSLRALGRENQSYCS